MGKRLKDTDFDIEGFIQEHLKKGLKDMCDKNDKVMEAIERAEERLRMNSKHIHILLQAVNTLLDDKIDGTLVEQTNE